MDSSLQRVTATDIARGRIRCGVELKKLLPPEAASHMAIIIRGQTVHASWNPRNGPDRGRSGVLNVGRPILEGLIEADERLTFELIRGTLHFH